MSIFDVSTYRFLVSTRGMEHCIPGHKMHFDLPSL